MAIKKIRSKEQSPCFWCFEGKIKGESEGSSGHSVQDSGVAFFRDCSTKTVSDMTAAASHSTAASVTNCVVACTISSLALDRSLHPHHFLY